MMTKLLDKYKEIEASSPQTNVRNDRLDIICQILLSDNLLESLKNSDEQLLSFFSNETIYTEIARFCFGFNSNFAFSDELLQQYQNENSDEIRRTLNARCLQVLLNIPSSFYDLLSCNLEFNEICANLLLHNIKCKIIHICSEILQDKLDVNYNTKLIETHFFGFFSQIIFKIMKWNFPIFFAPDVYKQKIVDKKEKCNINKEIFLHFQQDEMTINDQIKIQINDAKDASEKIENINKIIENFGLNLTLDINNDQQKSFISFSQNYSDPFFLNYKYISNLIIYNIHENYAMQEFLVDILKLYPEALPDGTIIKRLSQIACNDFNIKNDDKNTSANNNDNTVNMSNLIENDNINNEIVIQKNAKRVDLDFYFNKLKNCFCDRLDACYTIVDIYRSLPNESPIFYQFQDSTVLNNIVKAASIIYDEEKDKSNDSFKHTVLAVSLIDIVTKTVSTNSKLILSVELPSNIIINKENISEVTISTIELYLKKRANNKDKPPKLPNSSSQSNPPFYRRMSPSYHSFNSNLNNLSAFQYQSRNFINSNNDNKGEIDSKYRDVCELFKLFFTSEALQNKLINLFFNKDPTKQNTIGNKSLIQSSSTNCINKFDSPTPPSIRTGIDCSYPRSQSTGTWQQTDKPLSNDEISFLTAIANVPGLITNLERAFQKDHPNRANISRSKSGNNGSSTSSNLDLSSNSQKTSLSCDIFISTSSNNSMSMAVETSNDSSCETIDESVSSSNCLLLKWTPACKFLALSLAKLNTNSPIPVFNSRKWKTSVIPAIRKFGILLESNYGFNDTISRHRSCSMNDKLPVISHSSGTSSSLISPSRSFETSDLSINCMNQTSTIEKRRNSFEKVHFSPNYFPSVWNKENNISLNDDADDNFPSIKIEQDEDENRNEDKDENSEESIDQYEVEVNENDFENQMSKEKISKKFKNYPHSLNQLDNKCFSTLRANPFSFRSSSNISSPNSNSDSDSYTSSDSINAIKMSTQQTLIEKKKDSNKQTPQTPQVSSSNSEGDDEYLIDI